MTLKQNVLVVNGRSLTDYADIVIYLDFENDNGKMSTNR